MVPLAAARERETSSSSALRTLQDVATRFAGVSDGVRLLLTAGGGAGVRTAGVVADFVVASREVEGAAEAYLQTVLPAVVVEDDDDASRAARLIRAEGAGRTMFLSKTRRRGGSAAGSGRSSGPLPEALRGDPRVIGRLKDRLRFRSDDGFVGSCIGDAVLVDTLESALALHRVHPTVDYLAETGEVVYASGIIAAGGRAAGDLGLARPQPEDGGSAGARRPRRPRARRRPCRRRSIAARRGRRAPSPRWAEGRRRARDGREARKRARAPVASHRRREGTRRTAAPGPRGGDRAVAADDATARDRLAGPPPFGPAPSEEEHAGAEAALRDEVAALHADEAALRVCIDDEAAARADAAARESGVDAARREGARSRKLWTTSLARLDGAAAEREAAATRGREAGAAPARRRRS